MSPSESDNKKKDATVTASISPTKEVAKSPLAKNKKRPALYAIIALGAIFLVADEFLNQNEETPVESSAPTVTQPTTPQPQPPANKAEASPPPSPAEATPFEIAPQVEQVGQEGQEVQDPPPAEIAPDPPTEEGGPPEEEAPAPESPPIGPPAAPHTPPVEEEVVLGEQETLPPPGEERDAVEEGPPQDELNNSTQILKEIEVDPNRGYDPPDYLQKGRGLVYNCKQKHWACVNKASYFQCARNQKALSEKDAQPDCVINDIYFSSTHCVRGQLMKIHQKITAKACR